MNQPLECQYFKYFQHLLQLHQSKSTIVSYPNVRKATCFHDGSPYYVETSTLICRANQWTGFYIIGTSVIKEWKKSLFHENAQWKYYLLVTWINFKLNFNLNSVYKKTLKNFMTPFCGWGSTVSNYILDNCIKRIVNGSISLSRTSLGATTEVFS